MVTIVLTTVVTFLCKVKLFWPTVMRYFHARMMFLSTVMIFLSFLSEVLFVSVPIDDIIFIHSDNAFALGSNVFFPVGTRHLNGNPNPGPQCVIRIEMEQDNRAAKRVAAGLLNFQMVLLKA